MAILLVGCSGFHPQMVFDDGGVPLTPQAISESRSQAVDLAVRDGFVYWVEKGSFAAAGRDGKVLRAPVAGCHDSSCPQILAQDVYTPGGVTLSLDGTLLFYCELEDPKTLAQNSGRIWKITLGADETPYLFADKQGGPRKLAVDDTAVYWVNGDSGDLHRAWLDGPLTNAPVLSMLQSPIELTVDVAHARVFWTEYGSGDFGGIVSGADVTGDNLYQIGTAQAHPIGLSLGPTSLFWANSGNGTVMRANSDGTNVGGFASDRRTPNDVLVDGDWLLVAEGGTAPYFKDGRIEAMKLDGTETRTLADSQNDPRSLAVDKEAVYWVNQGTKDSDQYDASVMRVAKP